MYDCEFRIYENECAERNMNSFTMETSVIMDMGRKKKKEMKKRKGKRADAGIFIQSSIWSREQQGQRSELSSG